MKTLILLTCLAAAASAGAQTVWRCGPDGRDYRDAPCEQGRVVAVADDRSGADRSAARQVAAQDRALAQRLQHERLSREREQRAAGSGLAGFRTTPPLSAAAEKRAAKPTEKPSEKLQERQPKKRAEKSTTTPKAQRRPATPETYRAVAPSSRPAAG